MVLFITVFCSLQFFGEHMCKFTKNFSQSCLFVVRFCDLLVAEKQCHHVGGSHVCGGMAYAT